MSFPGLHVFTIWVSILVSIVEYSCNHHHLLMTAWVSCVCPAKNVVVRVLISYVVQWGESADIYFEVKLISFCFYILYFMDFTSACICKGTTLGQCLVTWVGSHLRAAISPIAFLYLPCFPFCDISCDSSKPIIGHSVNICQVPWEWCLDDLVV